MILVGDALTQLKTLPDASVHCCVTSPPYYGLRDYGVAGQIGLEETPEAYVAKLVNVFREVRRVLRDDGTLWVNLGDSYGASTQSNRNGKGKSTLRGGNVNEHEPYNAGTAKTTRRSSGTSKQLLGIPWRVAFALQQPYYTGTIKDERDRIWLAAMLDAEGCMFIHKRKAGQSNGQGYVRQSDNYAPGIEIANTSLAVIEKVMALVGKGSICSQSTEQNESRKQTIYRWNLRTTECRDFVREVYPHLVAKKHQARILCGCPSSGSKAEQAHAALIGLHRGIHTDVDFDEPDSMFEPGWVLRQDLIWSKPNPMPESVKDRCTKAHEYLFLLAKSKRYWFDSEAMKENTDKTYTRKGVISPQQVTRAVPDSVGNNRDGFTRSITTVGRNRRSVWSICPRPYKGAHFAVFPPALVEPCIKAGCPVGGTVLDPFGGSGTTGQVAKSLGRNAILIELNPNYIPLIEHRIA